MCGIGYLHALVKYSGKAHRLTSSRCSQLSSKYLYHFTQLTILKTVHGATIGGVSDSGIRFGVIQFGNRIYTETQLGATPNLKEFLSVLLNIQFRNDNYNDVPGALEGGIDMLNTR